MDLLTQAQVPQALQETPENRPPLPPYWRKTAKRCGGAPDNGVWIYTGEDGWGKARSSVEYGTDRITAMLPHRTLDPRVFSWPAKDMEVLVVREGDVEQDTVDALVLLLLENGAKIVRVIQPDDSLTRHTSFTQPANPP